MSNSIDINFPDKLCPIISSTSRYNVLYGGRAGSKSYNVCLVLLLRVLQQKLRILCCRELQVSIKDSVHRLLADLIETYKLPGFSVLQNEIRHENGSIFLFKGLKSSVAEVKSLQGVNICFVEEAQVVSQQSWDILLPTIREENSQFFITFNPANDEDPTWEMFVKNPRSDSLIIPINYYDNPFFPEVLRKEMEYDKATDPEKYKHVWLGECTSITNGTPVYGDLFHPALHIVKDFQLNATQPLILGFDFGETRSAWVVCQENPIDKKLIVLGSRLCFDTKTEKLADDCMFFINNFLAGNYLGMVTYADIQGKVGTSNATTTDWDILHTKGIFPIADQHKGLIIDGINVVRKKLSTITNKSAELLFVEKHNEFLIKGFAGKYVWKELSKSGEVKRDPKHDDHSHIMDALRYICINRYSINPTIDVKALTKKYNSSIQDSWV